MLDIDSFGAVMDDLLRDNHVQMLIDIPEGTLDATLEDNIHLGGVVQFYLLLHAIRSAVKSFADLLTDADAEKMAEAMADLVRQDIQEAIENTQEDKPEGGAADA